MEAWRRKRDGRELLLNWRVVRGGGGGGGRGEGEGEVIWWKETWLGQKEESLIRFLFKPFLIEFSHRSLMPYSNINANTDTV